MILTAVAFLYIGATDLLPELRHPRDPRAARGRLLGFLLGVALVAMAGLAERHVTSGQ